MKRWMMLLLVLSLTVTGCAKPPDEIDPAPSQIEGSESARPNILGDNGVLNPAEVLQKFSDSFRYDVATGELSFTVPEELDGELHLTVSGERYTKENWAGRWPDFPEVREGGWLPGETYVGVVGLDGVDYIDISATIEKEEGLFAGAFLATIDENGEIKRYEIQCGPTWRY